MYKEKIFTSGGDFKNLHNIRVDSRRLIAVAFALTLVLIVLIHTL